MMNIDQVAEYLNVKPRFVRRLVTERRIPFYKVGKFVRFDRAEIRSWSIETRITPVSERN